MASGGGGSPRREEGQVLRHLVQTLRSDLNLLSNEARKKYPAVREVRGARWGRIGLGAGVEIGSLGQCVRE